MKVPQQSAPMSNNTSTHSSNEGGGSAESNFATNLTIGKLHHQLLHRLDILLADDSPITKDQDSVVLLNDALLRLKIWGTDVLSDNTNVFSQLERQGTLITNTINKRLHNVALKINDLEQAKAVIGGSTSFSKVVWVV